jgi:hypothetical protein
MHEWVQLPSRRRTRPLSRPCWYPTESGKIQLHVMKESTLHCITTRRNRAKSSTVRFSPICQLACEIFSSRYSHLEYRWAGEDLFCAPRRKRACDENRRKVQQSQASKGLKLVVQVCTLYACVIPVILSHVMYCCEFLSWSRHGFLSASPVIFVHGLFIEAHGLLDVCFNISNIASIRLAFPSWRGAARCSCGVHKNDSTNTVTLLTIILIPSCLK